MSRLVLLARHGTHAEVGHVLSGRSEIGLADTGRAQAEALARRLAGTGLAAIHASPRQRTRDTAAAVARATGLEVRTAPALDEIDFGAFTGRSFDELDGDADWQRWNAERGTACCPGGETMAEAVARAWNFLHRLDHAPVLCVSHCDVIRGLVARALGLDYGAMFRFDCDPGSLTALAIEDRNVRVVTVNEVPPLSDS